MNMPSLESRDGLAIADGRIAEFRRAFSGDVILPGDAG